MTGWVWVLRIAAAAASAWLLCVLIVSLFQEKLIFHPQPMSPGSPVGGTLVVPPTGGSAPTADPAAGIEEIFLAMKDGVRLHGWFVPGPERGAVIYFGGNAEEVSSFALEHARLGGQSLALFNYRGYGKSGGRPGEKELFSDALEVYDWVVKRPEVDPTAVVTMGRSLGSGVAVHLAAHRPLRGALLVSPYDAISEMAKDAYPWVPVRWVLRHRFDSMSKAPGIRIPACFLMGAEDRTIPPARSRKLAAAWGGKVSLREIPGADHNSLDGKPEYWETIAKFLENP